MTDSEQSDITWHKSTASGATNCVEVAVVDDAVLVRNFRGSAWLCAVVHLSGVGSFSGGREQLGVHARPDQQRHPLTFRDLG